MLARTVAGAIARRRLEISLAETQSVAAVGSWELDLATNGLAWSAELCRLFHFGADESAQLRGPHRAHPP